METKTEKNNSPIDKYFQDRNKQFSPDNLKSRPLENAEYNDEGQRKEQLYKEEYENLNKNTDDNYSPDLNDEIPENEEDIFNQGNLDENNIDEDIVDEGNFDEEVPDDGNLDEGDFDEDEDEDDMDEDDMEEDDLDEDDFDDDSDPSREKNRTIF
jgi:hypothetical protein